MVIMQRLLHFVWFLGSLVRGTKSSRLSREFWFTVALITLFVRYCCIDYIICEVLLYWLHCLWGTVAVFLRYEYRIFESEWFFYESTVNLLFALKLLLLWLSQLLSLIITSFLLQHLSVIKHCFSTCSHWMHLALLCHRCSWCRSCFLNIVTN